MQLTFQFAAWQLSAGQGIVGRQYDNLSHSLVVVGALPAGYIWDMLVEARGKYNVIPLTSTETGASAPLTDDQLAFGDEYYAFQLRGTSGEIIHHTNAVQVYVPQTIVGPGTWPVLPTEFSQAEANIKELNAHPPVPGENGYWMLWDLDTHSYVQSQLVVPGLRIKIGETTTVEPGTPAKVTNSGTDTAPVLDFTIPEGEKGDAATIQVGKVTASDPGGEPKVTNSGTENAAVFDFVLPRGQTGPTGQAATIEVASTVTGEPGTQASVENVGTTGAAKLKFTIPRGNTGQNGVTPTLAAGDVETLEPGQPATASVTGEGPAYQINLGIPQGKTGETGAQGVQGEIGPRGYTFTPAVDDAGNLSWTNDGGLPNPEEVNIKGPIGATGPQGNPGATPTITVGTVTTLDPGQDATAEITGETPNLTLNLGIPEGQPGQDGVQLNDNAVNATEAWSSKKIVDTLCPHFSVSGNPVTCHPAEGYPLSAVVTLEPKQAGSGNPSPENVRPISGWDEVTVTRCGKNLLKLTGRTVQSVPSDFKPVSENTKYPVGDGYLYVGVTSNGYWIPRIITDYVITDNSISINTNTRGYGIGMCVKIVPGASYVVGKDGDDTNTNINAITTKKDGLVSRFTVFGEDENKFTAQDGEEWVIILFRPTPNALVTYQNPQLELGSAPTPYEPYQGETSTITLPETIYGGTVDAVTGVGSKTWGYIASYNGESLPGEWISDRDVYAPGTTPTTGAQVAYKLATPEPFQATGNQALPAVAGLNTVYTDGDSLAVSGRQDLLYTLQTMQAQTTNLNRFIAEGGAING